VHVIFYQHQIECHDQKSRETLKRSVGARFAQFRVCSVAIILAPTPSRRAASKRCQGLQRRCLPTAPSSKRQKKKSSSATLVFVANQAHLRPAVVAPLAVSPAVGSRSSFTPGQPSLGPVAKVPSGGGARHALGPSPLTPAQLARVSCLPERPRPPARYVRVTPRVAALVQPPSGGAPTGSPPQCSLNSIVFVLSCENYIVLLSDASHVILDDKPPLHRTASLFLRHPKKVYNQTSVFRQRDHL